MTNTPTTQLSGLELRKQVAMKLGYRVEPYQAYDRYILEENRYTSITQYYLIVNGDYTSFATAELAWQSCPAFEKDLGALQSSGVLDALFSYAVSIENDPMLSPVVALHVSEPEAPYRGVESEEYLAYACEHYENEGETASEALATAICRAFLAMETDAR